MLENIVYDPVFASILTVSLMPSISILYFAQRLVFSSLNLFVFFYDALWQDIL